MQEKDHINRINRIKISGFRRLFSVELHLKPFITLIGANGVGKTSLLDALSLLSASASGILNISLSRKGGIIKNLTRGLSDSLSFYIDIENPGYNPLKYELHLEPIAAGYSISKEVLSQLHKGHIRPLNYIDSTYSNIAYFDLEQNRIVSPNWPHDLFETSLSQVPKLHIQSEKLRRVLSTTTQYHVLNVSDRAPVKSPQSMKPATLPGSDGEDLVPYLYYLRETDQDRFEVIEDSLRAAFPDFEGLSFPPVAAGMLTMTWKDKRFSNPISIDELSEGTLRYLWLASLLQSSALSTITMIDEPEVSMHPELLYQLVDLMREASRRTQLIIATHSDSLIRFLKPEEVVVMDIGDDGTATAAWADSFDLDHWLSDYSLDELWRLGRIGGRA